MNSIQWAAADSTTPERRIQGHYGPLPSTKHDKREGRAACDAGRKWTSQNEPSLGRQGASGVLDPCPPFQITSDHGRGCGSGRQPRGRLGHQGAGKALSPARRAPPQTKKDVWFIGFPQISWSAVHGYEQRPRQHRPSSPRHRAERIAGPRFSREFMKGCPWGQALGPVSAASSASSFVRRQNVKDRHARRLGRRAGGRLILEGLQARHRAAGRATRWSGSPTGGRPLAGFAPEARPCGQRGGIYDPPCSLAGIAPIISS